MTLVKDVIRRFRASDGRIKIATLFGASALVTVIALLIGVMPVFANHEASKVTPIMINEGGGSGKCSVQTGGLPSVAGNEFHINNPTPGTHSNGAISVNVYDLPEGRVFDFDVVASAGVVVYDVVVNGGPKSNHYDYDVAGGPGAVSDDDALHAPSKNRNSLHNLSHINICYDVPGLTSVPCDIHPPIKIEGNGVLTIGEVTIFENSLHGCTDKSASFFIDGDVLTLSFLGEGGTVAGRLDITKEFIGPSAFVDLQYDGPGSFVDLPWCDVREKVSGDGNQFDDVLASDEYPDLPGTHTACKASEEENAAGVQVNAVYFEFEDPQFR